MCGEILEQIIVFALSARLQESVIGVEYFLKPLTIHVFFIHELIMVLCVKMVFAAPPRGQL